MNKQFLQNAFGWGFLLWLFGYVLGILLFFVVPTEFIGWIISPMGIVVTLLVLLKKIEKGDFKRYLLIGIVWVLVAIVLDYIFIVKALNPEDGYYKLDVYLYYLITFVLPILVGYSKKHIAVTR